MIIKAKYTIKKTGLLLGLFICLLLSCREVPAESRNTAMAALLPDEAISVSPPVIRAGDIYVEGRDEPVAYRMAEFQETDKDNPDYAELAGVAAQLSADCTSDKAKARNVLNYVVERLTYGGSLCLGEDIRQIYGIYDNPTVKCQGFSLLTAELLYLCDIPVAMVTNSHHMWNAAFCDGEWITLDGVHRRFDTGFEGEDLEGITYSRDGQLLCIDGPGSLCLAGLSDDHGADALLRIHDGVTRITDYAINDLPCLETLVIPASVKTVGDSAVNSTPKLKVVRFEGNDTIPEPTFLGPAAVGEHLIIQCPKGSYIDTHREDYTYRDVTVLAYDRLTGRLSYPAFKPTPFNRLDLRLPYRRTYLDLTLAKLTLSETDMVYDSTVKCPQVTVTLWGEVLVPDRDYTLTYENNIEKGTAMVSIEGRPPFEGVNTRLYEIR